MVVSGDMDMRIRNIDPTLSAQFKALCTLEGKTLGEKLSEMMREMVARAGLDRKR